ITRREHTNGPKRSPRKRGHRWDASRRWHNNLAVWLATLGFSVVVFLGLKIWMDRPSPPAPASDVKLIGGEVRLSLTSISEGKLAFFRCIPASGWAIRFLVVEAPPSHYRVALDGSENGTDTFREIEG